ncbi:FMN-binding protein [Persephonella sp.]
MRWIFLVFFISLSAYGGLLIKPEEALKGLFPEGEIDKKNILLKKKQAEEVVKLSKIKLKSKIVTVYLVRKKDKTVAYGILDTHKVRTKNEAVLYILDKNCSLKDIEIIAFYEPPEYIPSDRWLSIFEGKKNREDIKQIPNITGATLSARAVKKYALKSIAVCRVLFGDER